MRGIGRQIVEIDSQTDHGGLVADGVHAVERGFDLGPVGHVCDDQLGGGVHLGPAPMHRRQQRVEDPNAVASRHKHVDHVGTDEPGAAGNQDAHTHGR